MRFPFLNRVSDDRLALDAVIARLHTAGVPAAWSAQASGVTYAHFRLGTGAQTVNGWMAVNDWMAARSPALAGLAWQGMDPAWAARLLSELRPPLASGPGPHVADGKIRFVGLSTPVTPRILPAWKSDEGSLLLDGHCDVAGNAPHDGLASIAAWHLPVSIRLASLTLDHSLLARARPGDVLLLDALLPRGYVEQTALFSLFIAQESLNVEDIFDSMNPAGPSEDADMDTADAGQVDLHGLPVKVDVVLLRMDMTLGALSSLQPGSTLPVDDEAYRRIRLEVGGRCIARGELVQVGEQALGIQLHHVSRRR